MSVLKYSIHDWTSFSANYKPENILTNKPSQQSSRWSSETNTTPQHITLSLEEPAIVYSIIFGKYEKMHVCNLKKFKVFGGLEENHMIELLEGGLKNDSNAEELSLKHKVDGQPFPCRFIKIVPLMSWGATFNFSIWYIELRGVKDDDVLQPCLKWYRNYRENQVLHLCLKHFRQCNYMEAFHALQKQTNIRLEDPFITELHRVLVQEGDFESCEKLVETAAAKNMFSSYLSQQQYHPKWKQVIVKNTREKFGWPAKRGGHQLCADYLHSCLYLFGGWNGTEDLADLWKFCCTSGEWTMLSSNTEKEGGPSARSCHKICIDCQNQKIYTLGRYLDSAKRSHKAVENDFYVYNVLTNEWHLIAKDVALLGGPRLVFDHQMCFDERTKQIFVFGGRILTSNSRTSSGCTSTDERAVPEFGGLYSYSVTRNEWKLLREDSGNAGPQDIRSRTGHCMLLDDKRRCLFVFGGQRIKESINDFFSYNIDEDFVIMLSDGNQHNMKLTPSGSSQRATIDSDLGEIYMLSGMSKEKDRDKRDDAKRNSFWVYSIINATWKCVFTNEPAAPAPMFGDASKVSTSLNTSEPHPRFAHQLVYDSNSKLHYLFGGNPGNPKALTLRLDDLWCLNLVRPSLEDLLRHCKFEIREHRFFEIASSNRVAAIRYLQNEVSQVVNHAVQEEASSFQSLASEIFEDQTPLPIYSPQIQDQKHAFIHSSRTQLFEILLQYFPDEMKQPSENLRDLVSFTV